MDPLDLALNGVLPPIVAALVLVGLGGGRCLGLAVALGLLAAFVRLELQWPQVPPANGQQGLVLALCLGGLVALLPEHVPRSVRLGLGLAVCAATVPLLLWRAQWPLAGKLAVAPFLALVWWLAARIAKQHPPRTSCAAWCAGSAALAIALLHPSRQIGQMTGAAAAVLGTSAVLALVRPLRIDAQACLPIALAFGGWLVAGQALAEPALPVLLCAALAPFGMLLGRTVPGQRKPWLAYGVTAVLSLAAAGMALPAVLEDLGG